MHWVWIDYRSSCLQFLHWQKNWPEIEQEFPKKNIFPNLWEIVKFSLLPPCFLIALKFISKTLWSAFSAFFFLELIGPNLLRMLCNFFRIFFGKLFGSFFVDSFENLLENFLGNFILNSFGNSFEHFSNRLLEILLRVLSKILSKIDPAVLLEIPLAIIVEIYNFFCISIAILMGNS